MSMNVIHLGSGTGDRQWVDAVERFPGARNMARVAGAGSSAVADKTLPHFASLEEALASVSADVAVVCGPRATDLATRALQCGLAVVMDEVGAVDGVSFRAFRQAAQAKPSSVFWPRRYRYARCENVLKRLLDSRRLGGIGHVSCIDEARSPGEEGGQSSAVPANALAHWKSLQQLFGTSPKKVIARLRFRPESQRSTQAFIEFDNGMHVHYSGTLGAQRDAHELWIEGAGGSVRTDGSSVWWRKRGWRFFMPLSFPFPRDSRDSAEARAKLDTLAAANARTAASPEDLSAMAAVAAAIESDRRHAAVPLSELTG